MNETAYVDAIWDATLERLASQRRLPEATYRWQFHAGFTFGDARQLVGYLHELGISDCYASPLFLAREGSTHGYDICDPNALNPEIGTLGEFEQFCGELSTRGMGLVLDVVPNHMGIASAANAWWQDVLENGPGSPYASFFDIEWHPIKPDLDSKVLLPFLGDQYGRVLEAGQLRLGYAQGAFSIHYFQMTLPVAPCTSATIITPRIDELEQQLGKDHRGLLELQSIITGLGHLPPRDETDREKVAERQREKEILKHRLAALTASSPEIAEHIARNVERYNGQVGQPGSFDLLDLLLLAQAYRLAYWQVAADEINYRRFFDVNELAAITVENLEVFEETHRFLFALVDQNRVGGIRIDHPDGLFDPPEYLRRLQERHFMQAAQREAQRHVTARGELADARSSAPSATEETATAVACAPPEIAAWDEIAPQLVERYRREIARNGQTELARSLYVVVEKILSRGESLPGDWPVHGTTGYEFMDAVDGLLVDRAHEREMTRCYERFIGHASDFSEQAYLCRQLIMDSSMSSELAMLAQQLDRLSEQNRLTRDFTLNSLTAALREVAACFPVYRTYLSCAAREGPVVVDDRDRHFLETAVARAKRRNPTLSASIFDYVRDTLLLRPFARDQTAPEPNQRHFVGRFQQFTSPVMAKGVEDTTFYRYNRLVSLNEVGGRPDSFGLTCAAFHHQNLERANRWPRGLLATSTHDNKRGEDVRARISVLSEIPGEWRAAIGRWSRWNRRLRGNVDGLAAPDRNDEYLLYQTLVGSWPVRPLDADGRARYVERMQAYLQKALREAKRITSWISPHAEYETQVSAFIAGLFDPEKSARFLDGITAFVQRVQHIGLFNGLSQTLLKLTSPGVPDLYQGCEIWDDSLVDPDNRRPVDYARRRQMLDELKQHSADTAADRARKARELVQSKTDGRIKLFIIWQALGCRRQFPGLFTEGQYLPVEARESRAEHVCAFVRSNEQAAFLIVVPRLYVPLCGAPDGLPLGRDAWHDTTITIDANKPLLGDFALAAREWRSVFTGERVAARVSATDVSLDLAEVLAHFPVALLQATGAASS